MSYLVGEMEAYLLVAAIIGALIGWFLSRCKCNKAVAEIESQKQALNNELNSVNSTLDSRQQQLEDTQNTVVQLRSELALTQGNAHLMASRWQSTLKQARQVPNQLKWIQSLQTKLANKNTQLSQNRKYAEAKAWEAKVTKENLARVHSRLTEVDARAANLKEWVTVFQTKLVKTKSDYSQLRNFADAVARSDRAHKDNLARTHLRLTEIEGKQQPLRTWIRVFQTKLMKTKSDYAQLRSYADNIQASLDASEDNLARTHTRLSEVSRELAETLHRKNNPMPPLPPAADVTDNSCEEKDAIINSLRAQLRSAENRAQKAPVVQLDQSVRIKQLESEVAKLKAGTQQQTRLESELREHKFTIDAYRSKLSSTRNQLFTQRIQSTDKDDDTPPSESNPASDDLKLIKGIGPKLEGMLNDLGIYKFSQIAEWTQQDIHEISSKLGSFKDRISRDDWVKKARKLDKSK